MKRITLCALLITLFLLLSCGSGTTSAEDSQGRFLKSVISLGNDFLNVFTSLSDMVGGVLGFNTTTKKSDVENYFKTIEKSLTTTKTSLEKIVSDMKSEKNPNAEATDTAVKKLVSEILNKIIEGAKTASEVIGDAGDPIGNVGANNAAGVVGTEVDKLVKGIKDIVAVVLKEGNPEAGTDKKAEDLSARTANGNGEAGKLFAANAGDDANAKKVAADAAKAVGAVTGADILKAMIKNGANSAVEAAKANAKDGTIAGAIALTAMAKDGKFAGPTADSVDYVTAAKGAAISAVTKALGTLTIAIRNTVDVGLKTVKDAMKFNSTDTPVTTDNTTSETKK
ncbi:variable large family protein [Borrelia puertoricensis]|uniref:variable large family protein n=1 Tax=Borrelia puertoricensis TaxID=2756107 RepID=UPI001FF66E3C|nr:variable large family protein [Borrelia puertoricensis]UPA19156.1 variable large family protein [Borrelia puertoricensis]